MSLLSPDPRLALAPDRVALLAGRHYRERNCDEPGWPGALEALAQLLGEHPVRGRVEVVLSQHFAASHLMAPPAVPLAPAEARAWLAEQLAGRYGEAARDWHLAWQPAPAEENLLVASLPAGQHQELAEALVRLAVRPGRVRPWLAACCDRHWRRLGRGRHWLILAEAGRFSLAALDQGRFLALASRRCGPDAGPEIAAELSRQALLADLPTDLPCWLATTSLTGNQAVLGRPLASGRGGLAAMLED